MLCKVLILANIRSAYESIFYVFEKRDFQITKKFLTHPQVFLLELLQKIREISLLWKNREFFTNLQKSKTVRIFKNFLYVTIGNKRVSIESSTDSISTNSRNLWICSTILIKIKRNFYKSLSSSTNMLNQSNRSFQTRLADKKINFFIPANSFVHFRDWIVFSRRIF